MTFWEVLVNIIIFCWFARVTLGAAYGIYLLRKWNYTTVGWGFIDCFVAGPAFWIGWLIGTGLRWLSKKVFKRFYK